MTTMGTSGLADTGERIIPPSDGEVSFVFARHEFAYKYAQRLVEGRTVLDVGCGTGYGCAILAERAKLVVGVDYDLQALSYCRTNFPRENIRYVHCDAMSLSFTRRFDVAVSFQVIEHMVDVEGFLKQLRSVVKVQGLILISTPNVPVKRRQVCDNPFHHNEFHCDQFRQLLGRMFDSFELFGVAYESRSVVRQAIQALPFYRWGVRFRRRSRIKKLADRALGLSQFRVTERNPEKSMDLLAVCTN